MKYYLGIDGGGSTLRVALVDEDLRPTAESQGGTANPNIIGFDAAKALIQSAVREVISAAPDREIAGVGIGIAGASLAFDWMRETIADVLPAIPVFPAIDVEIALVGAHGARRGVLILAGTGSIAYGINDAGETVQGGGWGHLLGDEGSGYWLGLQALRAVIAWADGLDPTAEMLARRVMERLNFETPRHLVRWAYRQPAPIKEIAALAHLVLDADDPYALPIVEQGAKSLAAIAQSVIKRLNVPDMPIAFAGGLLLMENSLSRVLCRELGFASIPQPKYPPVIGAALLAKLMLERNS